MRIWKEREDGTLEDTRGFVNKWAEGDRPREVFLGRLEQALGAVHSNGAMLVWNHFRQDFTTPNVPFAVIEPFRERLFPYPLMFLPQPLANFAVTLHTERSKDRAEWVALQVMLAASFLKHAQSTSPDAR